MLRNNPKITDLLHESAVKSLSLLNNITIQESKNMILEMSFKQYMQLLEAGANITPPSGQTIGPSASAPSMPGNQQVQQNQPAQNAPQKAQPMYAGKGSPIQQGMTVGIQGPNGNQLPGQITQVDAGRKSVAIKNPTTGQEEWVNNDDLQPYSNNSQPQQNNQQSSAEPTGLAEEIKRIKQLAGLSENSSAGASCAGAIASAPSAMGTMKRRPVDENSMDEYTPTVAKTVVGDTKPGQDSGKLSARLAKAGKPTASRTNNGFKK